MLPPWHCQHLTPSQTLSLMCFFRFSPCCVPLPSQLPVDQERPQMCRLLLLSMIHRYGLPFPKRFPCYCVVIIGIHYHQGRRHNRMQQDRPATPNRRLAQGVLAPVPTRVWKTCTKLLLQVSLVHFVNLRELLLVLLCLRAALAWRLPIESPPS